MNNYQVLFHQTPHTKTFLFATSQLISKELVTEFFYVVFDESNKVHKEGRTVTYPPNVLSLMEVPDPIVYGLQAVAEQGKNQVSMIFMNKYFMGAEEPTQRIDLRFKFIFDNFELSQATLATIAYFAPDEEHFSFIYQTRCNDLKNFIQNAFLIKKVIQISPMSKT